MKKLLLSLLVLAGFIAAAPRAEAARYVKVYNKHGVVWVPRYSNYGYSSYYGGRSYRHHHRSHHRSYRYVSYPSYRTNYYRSYPRYYSSSYYRPYPYYYDSGYYRSSCHSSPRISVSFGF